MNRRADGAQQFGLAQRKLLIVGHSLDHGFDQLLLDDGRELVEPAQRHVERLCPILRRNEFRSRARQQVMDAYFVGASRRNFIDMPVLSQHREQHLNVTLHGAQRQLARASARAQVISQLHLSEFP